MRKVRAVIFHLSDLHFGRSVLFRQTVDNELLRSLRRIVGDIIAETRVGNNTAKYIIAVTGDLCEHPSPFAMAKASRYLRDLASGCGIDPSHIVVVPGNHDFKFQGNFGLRRLTRIPFEVYFRQGGIDLPLSSRWLVYGRLLLNALLPWGKELRDQDLYCFKEIDSRLVLIGFNSTPLVERFMWATGKVSNGQIFDLETKTNSDAELDGKDFFKVALVHHHPLPIPYTKTGLKERIEEGLLIFHNAGTFLRQLGHHDVDLVLHGHKHYAAFTRVTFDLPDGSRRAIGILGAGSATCLGAEDPLGNEFNVIRVYDDDTVDIEQRYYDAVQEKKAGSLTVPFYTFNDIKDINIRRTERSSPYKIRSLEKIVKLTEHGFSEVIEQYKGCAVVDKDGLEEFPFCYEAKSPTYLRNFRLLNDQLQFASLRLATQDCDLRTCSGKVHLGALRRPGDDCFDLGFAFRIINSHALNARELSRKYPGKNVEWEWAGIECAELAEELKIVVEFPGPAYLENISDYGPYVSYRSILNNHELSRVPTVVKAGNSLTLNVHSPIPGYYYGIRWKYRNDDAQAKSDTVRQALLEHVRAMLLALPLEVHKGKWTTLYEKIYSELKEYAATVTALYDPITSGGTNDRLDVHLAIFDPSSAYLRFVAGTGMEVCGGAQFGCGEGCVGFTFEKARVLFYDRRKDSIGYYISRQELKRDIARLGTTRGLPVSLREYTTLVTIPWRDQYEHEIGAICVGSTSNCSRLLRFFDQTEDEKNEDSNLLAGLTTALGELIIKYVQDYEDNG